MIDNKVAIITGGSSGIGKALAFELGRQGAKVVISGRNQQNLFETQSELQKAGIEALAVVGDVTNEAETKQLIDRTLERFGQIDILINNAGMSMRSMFAEADVDVIKKLMEVNFYGAVHATKYALPHITRTKGSIVAISSIAGYRGLPVRTGYSASKFAMNGFFEALRTELLHTGVHVLVACPGFTQSNIRFSAIDGSGASTGETVRDEANMMTAEECAEHIVKAIKNRKRDLVLTAQGKLAVWLNKLWPSMADRIVFNTLAKEKNSPLAQK